MEESEKRKERLSAIRAGAVQSKLVDGQSSSASQIHLLNPLTQPSATLPGAEGSPLTSRFDYYTDPMSAYSGNKRSVLGHCPPDSLTSPVRGSSPMAHLPSPSSAGQGRQYTTPTPVPANQFQVSYSPHQGSYLTPPAVRHYDLWRSPVGMVRPFPGHDPVGMPGRQDEYGSISGCGLPHNSSKGIPTSPVFGRGASLSANSGRGNLSTSSGRGCASVNSERGCASVNSGRGNLSANSGRGCASVNSGRGGSWRPGNYQSPCSGRSSQGGRGSKEFVSARDWPQLYFCKPMVLDPWVGLEPVVGCIILPPAKQMTPGSLKSWLPESIRTKKAKLTETVSVSHSKGSLAEYIALAFEEAVDNETAQ